MAVEMLEGNQVPSIPFSHIIQKKVSKLPWPDTTPQQLIQML